MNKRELKKELELFDKKKLIDLISDIYDKNNYVKEYLEYILSPNEKETLEIYKIKVKEAFYPKRGFGYKLANGKKAISDFRKLNPSAESIIDLLLCYVESGVKFTNDYGDIDEGFYSSIESVYHDAMKWIGKNELHDKFKDRTLDILEKTKNIGWGFHDTLTEIYIEFYD